MKKVLLNPRRSMPNHFGFTLIELMVTLLVAGIFIVVAVPSFQDATLTSKLGSLANSVVATVNVAKGEAIKRNAVIKMCASSTGTSCATSEGWQQGWIVFRDTDNDGTLDSDETLIHRQAALSSGIRLTAVDSDSNALYTILLQPTGVGATSAVFTLCRSQPKPGKQERVISVSTTARTNVSKTTTGTCS